MIVFRRLRWQGRKSRPPYWRLDPLKASPQARLPAPQRVLFHGVSRAVGPSQQATENDGLPHCLVVSWILHSCANARKRARPAEPPALPSSLAATKGTQRRAAGCQPAPHCGGRGGRVQRGAGGLTIRRRLKTCPTIRRGPRPTRGSAPLRGSSWLARSETKDVLLAGAQSLDITTMFVDNKHSGDDRGEYGRQRRMQNQPYGQRQGGRHDDRTHGNV